MRALTYYIPYKNVYTKSLLEFRRILDTKKGVRLSAMTLSQLCDDVMEANGVYFFFDDRKCLQYIGKATSKSFIERIPAHFDPRRDSWFNTVTKKMTNGGVPYSVALRKSLCLSVILLGAADPVVATRLESIFRHSYRPALNAPKKSYLADQSRSLEDLVKS